MPESLAFGLIGCGEIAVRTSDNILTCESARVVHCMDVREDLAADLAARHGAKSTSSLDELLADNEVEAVVISTPHYLHSPQTVAAARAGKHVLVEKPIACTLGQADEMIAAAKAAQVKLCVLFPLRFHFPAVKARELVAGGALGDIVAVKMDFITRKDESYWTGGFTGRATDDWRASREKGGGGCLIMNLIHNLDGLVSILDLAPTRIYAEYDTFCTPVEVEDFVSFVMRLESGAIVTADATSAAPGDGLRGDRIIGRKGQIAMTYQNIKVFLDEPCDDLPAGEWISLPTPDDFPAGKATCLDGFVRAILQGGEVPISGQDARRSLEIVRGAYLSMERGRPVQFPVQE